MDDVEAMMAELSKRYGRDGMRAIATLMHDLGSDAIITFAEGEWLLCDALMQLAWANGGQPESK